METTKKRFVNLRRTEAVNPRFIILFFMVAIYPLVVVPNVWFSYYTTPRYIVLAFFAMAAVFFLYRDRIRFSHPVYLALVVFLILALLSTLMSSDPRVAFYGSDRCTGYSTYLLCAILFIFAAQSQQGERLLVAMVAGAAVLSGIAVLQYFGFNLVPNDPLDPLTGVYGTMGNQNWVGTYTVFILPASILFYLNHSGKFMFFVAILIYAALLVTLTRGVWLTFLIIFLLILGRYWPDQQMKKRLLKLILAFALITVILSQVNGGLMLQRVISIPGQITDASRLDNDAGSGRIGYWKETSKLLPDYWIFGLGADRLYTAHIVIAHQTVDKAHNVYLEMAVTMGVFTLLAYLNFLSYFLRKWKNDQDYFFAILVLSYIIQGLTNNDVIMVMPIFWIVLGLSMQKVNIITEKRV